MVSSKLKEKFEASVSKVVKPLASIGVTPNQLTVLGFLVSLFAGLSFLTWYNNKERLLAGGILILVSGMIDAVDGILARITGKVTKFGGFFDSVADRYSDATVLSGIILGGLCNPFIGLATLVGTLMVSYTRSRSEAEGVKMAGVGLAERAERMIFLAIFAWLNYWWHMALNYGVLILGILAHFTVIQRGLYFKKEIEKD